MSKKSEIKWSEVMRWREALLPEEGEAKVGSTAKSCVDICAGGLLWEVSLEKEASRGDKCWRVGALPLR